MAIVDVMWCHYGTTRVILIVQGKYDGMRTLLHTYPSIQNLDDAFDCFNCFRHLFTWSSLWKKWKKQSHVMWNMKKQLMMMDERSKIGQDKYSFF